LSVGLKGGRFIFDRVNGGRPPGIVLVKGREVVAGKDDGGTPGPPRDRDFIASMLLDIPGGSTGMVGNPVWRGLAVAPVPLTNVEAPVTDPGSSDDTLKGTSEKPVVLPVGTDVVPAMV